MRKTLYRAVLSGIGIAAMVGACSSSANVHAGSHLDTDLQYIAAQVGIVQSAVADYAKSPSQANLDQLAQTAQSAHDEIDKWRGNIGVDGNATTNAINAQVAAGDLKNSMGALVALSGTPNAATLASFTSQFSNAVAEWNSAVSALYKGVKSSEPPPTISCPNC